MVKLVETKQSGFCYFIVILFLAIILSILANIIWAGQNIDNNCKYFYFLCYTKVFACTFQNIKNRENFDKF